MLWTQIPAGELNAAEQRIRVALGEEASTVIDRINSEPNFVDIIARLMINGGFEPTTSQKRAREIMGSNMFGVEDAIKHLGVNPSKSQLALLSEIPFSEETLTAAKDTHVLVAVFPLSILDIRRHVARGLFVSYEDAWYNKQAFSKEKGEIGWKLVRKTHVENSTSKNWDEQQALLGKDDETPSAQVVIYTMIGHYLATGEKLFESVWVRTSSVDSDGLHVYVRFVSDGVHVVRSWDSDRDSLLGLSSARKSND